MKVRFPVLGAFGWRKFVIPGAGAVGLALVGFLALGAHTAIKAGQPLNPMSIMKGAVSGATTIASQVVPPSILGIKPSPTPGATPAAGKVAGATTNSNGHTPASPAPGTASSPSPSNGDAKLVLEDSDITLAGGTIATPNYRAWTTGWVTSKVKVYSPTITGLMTDVGVLALPIVSECPYSNGEWCTKWSIGAQRGHPEGSGSATYTLTTHDEAGHTYSAKLTVHWLPIPYYYLAAGRTEIVTGQSGQWGTLTGIVIHAIIQPSANFGNPKLQHYGASLPTEYPCIGTPAMIAPIYPNSRQYDGDNDVATVCWIYPSQAEALRSHGGTARVLVQTDFFTDFPNQAVDVPIATW